MQQSAQLMLASSTVCTRKSQEEMYPLSSLSSEFHVNSKEIVCMDFHAKFSGYPHTADNIHANGIQHHPSWYSWPSNQPAVVDLHLRLQWPSFRAKCTTADKQSAIQWLNCNHLSVYSVGSRIRLKCSHSKTSWVRTTGCLRLWAGMLGGSSDLTCNSEMGCAHVGIATYRSSAITLPADAHNFPVCERLNSILSHSSSLQDWLNTPPRMIPVQFCDTRAPVQCMQRLEHSDWCCLHETLLWKIDSMCFQLSALDTCTFATCCGLRTTPWSRCCCV